MTELTLDVYTSPMRDISTGGQFSPTTSALLTGPTEAVLVDAQYMEGDVAELARRIESSGRTLTTIYITAHADHYFGLKWFINEVDDSADSRDMVARIQQRYPDHGNPSALILSAVTAFKRKRHATN